jgi:subtilase-type serine protease
VDQRWTVSVYHPSGFHADDTTNTILSNGILSVNGILNTPFLYMSGGVLNGAGMITGPGGTWVANVGGTVAPGTASAFGTLTIQGNYLQGPSGELQVRLAGIGNNDRLTVTGQAILSGTLVTLFTSSPLIVLPDSVRLTRQYTVLHADGGLGGLLSTALQRSTCQPTFLQLPGMMPTTFP